MANSNLTNAKRAKNDEFYTQYGDIQKQFELLGSNRGVDQDPKRIYGRGSHINGKETFKRVFIRHKKK